MDSDISNFSGSTSGTYGQVGTTSTGSLAASQDVSSDASLLTSNWEKSSLGQSQTKAGTTGYNNLASNPSLPPATQNDPAFAQTTIQHLYDFPKIMHNLVSSGSLQSSSGATTVEEEKVVDPEIIALAESEGESPGSVNQSVRVQRSSNFKALLRKLPSALLSQYPNAEKQLLFAFNNPEQAASLPKELQNQLNTMVQTANSQTAQQYGFSSTWAGVPPNTEEFNQTISDQYDAAFQNALQGAAISNNLSTSDVALLQSMHFLPGSASTTDPKLLAILNSCQTAATASVQQQFGIDPSSSFTITSDADGYTQTLNGAYRQALSSAIQQRQPPLTSAQQQAVEAYLADPEASSNPEIAQLAKSLQATAITSVIAQFGLNSDWKPTVTSLYAPGVDPALSSTVQSALATAHEYLQNADNLVASMPPGEQQTSYMNFLKTIGIALDNAQNAILAVQGSQVKVSKLLSTVQMQTQMDNLLQQKNAVKEMKDKQAKMVDTSVMNSVMDWVMKAIMLIVAVVVCAVNPVLGAMMVVATVFSIIDSAVAQATKKPSLTSQMFTSISDALGPAGGAAVNLLLSVIMSGGNPLLFMQLMMGDANVVGGFVKACGGTEEEQMITTAVIQGVIMIAAAVVMAVVTMGAGTAAVLAEIMETVAKITDTAVKTATAAVKIAMTVIQVGLTCVQIAGQACTINNGLLMSKIVLIKGRSDAQSEQIQALIEMLKMLIAKLLEMLKGGSDAIVNIQNLQSKKYSDASEISSQIANAIPT